MVLTANGEVHTHEEAQVFVHGLNLFVTVQLIEETPAVFALGKLREDNVYSYEWVSGQNPRLTKNGKSIICKTDNFVPLVVPGLSANSGSVFVFYIAIQDSLRREVKIATGSTKRSASSSSSGSVFERSDGIAPGSWCGSPQKTQNKKKKRADRKNSDGPVCEIFLSGWRSSKNIWRTQNCLHPHTFFRKHPSKVVSKSRTHSIYTHFSKNRNSAVCLRTKKKTHW